MSAIRVDTSVQGGYNGGATIAISVDGVVEFTAYSSDTWNRVYDNTSANVSTSIGTLHIQINEPGNDEAGKTKHLEIVLSVGNQTETQDIAPNGDNNSYGYSYSGTYTLNGAATQVHKYRVRSTDTSGDFAALAVDIYIDNVLTDTFDMFYNNWTGSWKEFDGLIKVGYNTISGLQWTIQIIDNIQGYSTGDNISWYYSDTQDITLEEVLPFTIKYLLKSGNDYYTIQNDVLTNIGSTLNAQLFADYGLDSVPDYDDYSSLSNPSIYKWSDEALSPFTVKTIGAPANPQAIISETISLSGMLGIENVVVTCEGNPVFAVSVDDGTTWKMWNSVQSRWDTVSQINAGMTATELNSVATSNWNTLIAGASSIKIRFTLLVVTDKVTNVILNYILS